MNITIKRTVNLSEPVLPEVLSAPLYEGEKNAHTFALSAVKDKLPHALSGSVVAYFERNDGNTVRVEGETIDGCAILTLSPECYQTGVFYLAVMLIADGAQTVIYAASGRVRNTQNGEIIDGGNTIPTYDEIMAHLNKYLSTDIIAKVEETEDGARITMKDVVNGETVARVKNGKHGVPGFSPTAKVTQTADGATVEVTDKNGTTSAKIKNGQPGDPGFSPTAKVTQTADGATIEITDKGGTTSAIVKNGKDGAPGETNVFIVREIINGISDKSKEETEAAAKAGKAVLLVTKYGEVYIYYAKEKIPGTDEFAQLFVMPITKATTGKRRAVIYLRADNALLRASETPFTAVAENPLTIKSGKTTVTYDGSEKKEIEIVDNVFVVKFGFDENYNFTVDKTQAEVKQAVADGKTVIMQSSHEIGGQTYLYMGERLEDGDSCPVFVSPLYADDGQTLYSNVVYMKKSGEVEWLAGAPIRPLSIRYGDENYLFDGRDLLTVNIKDDVFVVRVSANGKADQTQSDTIAAKDKGKAVLLITNSGEVYTYNSMSVHPDYASDISPVFVSPINGDFGGTKYRTLAYLLPDKTVVTRTEEIKASGGSGGGSESTECNLPKPVAHATLFDSVLTLNMDGQFGVTENVALKAGERYTISINGQAFEATAVATEAYGANITYLGNGALVGLGGLEDTGESYLFGIAPDLLSAASAMLGQIIYGLFVPADADLASAASVSVKIEGKSNKHLMLVTDSDGKTIWEERTHYDSETSNEILPPYAYTEADTIEFFTGQDIAIRTPINLELSGENIVNYNGVEYKCTAVADEGVAIGNLNALNPSLLGNDEPFIILSGQGMDITGDGCYAVLVPLDGITNGEISIQAVKKELKKIPNKFLPEPLFGEAEEKEVFLPETTVMYGDGIGGGTTPLTKKPKPGQMVIVNWDGVEYECEAIQSSMSEYYSVTLGDAKSFGGIGSDVLPFAIAITTPQYAAVGGASFLAIPRNDAEVKDTYTVSIYIPKGYVKRIDHKYMPKGLNPVWNIRSTYYDAVVNGEELQAENKYYSDLRPDQIVALLKTGALVGMNLCGSDGTWGYIYQCYDISTALRGDDEYIVEAYAKTKEDLGLGYVTKARIEWSSSSNEYKITETRYKITSSKVE